MIDKLIKNVASANLPTEYGDFKIYVYETFDKLYHVALVKGEIKEPTLVRVHSECLTADIFKSKKCDCGEQLDKALQMIGSERLNKTSGIDRLEFYFKLYEPTHSWKIHILEWPGYKRKLVSMIVDTYYEIFGDIFLVPFQEMYFRVADTGPFLKARLKHLPLRLKSAIKDYDDIIKNVDLVKNSEILLIDYKNISTEIIRSEMMFFKGQALWDMKEFNKCKETFENLLKIYPDTRWLGLAYFYLGNCYENLYEIDKAIEIYKKTTTDIASNFIDIKVSKYLDNTIEMTPAAIHLMNLLKHNSINR